MSKEHFMAAHEELVEEYLDKNPDASYDEAYEKTADQAWERMRDNLASIGDYWRMKAKEGS